MSTIEDAEKGMPPTNPPPSYKSSQTHHGASQDIAKETSDANTDRRNRSTPHDPAMSRNHVINLSASNAPRTDIGDEPDVNCISCFAFLLRDTSLAARCTLAVHGASFVCVFYHLVVAARSEDCAQAGKLTAYLNYLLGAIMGVVCVKLPTILGLHLSFDDSEGAQWVLSGLGWWFAIMVGGWMGTTWTPAQCET
ncbi:hypothetical protein KC343_g3271 [Hortaea werneckii]|uniref:Uncharacterized protein n=1 Tax=Hortaea werneckii TaxID=91943 RepID=A0A3M7EPC2_HORWE|nr:hypothetical protein KC352_g17306 [Hortaea werneckii]KAI7569038.1 hypothetical protein KC317_g3667 [Hortaea werneckii]KAI7622516.1 hypothetical protein KC346_g3167 [Hortaea werneckii]KAI7632828.1 hypothetical protein KC343_g3271 [Hortaea werneckii]KAI7667156.1 hypothetical protein KC322_g16599 [Hortaea werneckii]